jgi:Na+/H+ antiporter NhaC
VQEFGAFSLIPTLVVLALAITTRRTIEALITGSIVGAFMVAPSSPLNLLTEKSIAVLTDEDVAWVILVCGLMGSLIALLIRTGATRAFASSLTRFTHSRARALFVSWVMGLFLFVDDYLNSLAVGSSMRSVTDKFRTPRELLAYVVDSTAAPISVIIPISTWAVFFGALLEENGVAPDGQGIWTYIQAIPYMFYAWIAAAIVPLVIFRVIPLIGPMKSAQERAEEKGLCVPPGAEHIELANQSIEPKPGVDSSFWHLVLPMVALAGSTWYFDIDFLKGIYLTLALWISFILLRRMLTIHETFDTMIDGFKSMIEPLAVLVAAFLLKEVNDSLGLTEYIITAVKPLVAASTLPVLIFLIMGLVSFATGSNWGVFVIVLPIVVSLATSLEADMVLVIGATLSASTFGSHACFYSDATVLTAQACGCTPFQHAYTHFPYSLLAAAVSAVGYILVV